MSEERKLAHVERIPIRWGDMDAMGHVNNTVYFRYMEQTRIGWFDALVPEEQAWKNTSIVVANASCNFRRAINYPGTVEVKLYVGKPGGSSVPTSTSHRSRCSDASFASRSLRTTHLPRASSPTACSSAGSTSSPRYAGQVRRTSSIQRS